jgi:hypothetical protein
VAETYKLELYASGPYVGCNSTELVDLSDYGYSDEEWDELTEGEREDLLNEWGEEYFWNEGYEYNASVKTDG